MGTRFKTFESTGIAPNGRLYAGDLNLMQDQYADLSNFIQTVDVGNLRVGEVGLQLLRYGSGEFRMSGALRTDGILRGLGGVYAGAFSTAQRDAISAGFRPYGLIILNTTTNKLEWNKGTDAAPDWQPSGVDPLDSIILTGGGSKFGLSAKTSGTNAFEIRQAGEAQLRFYIRADGAHFWGGGVSGLDTWLSRDAPGRLALANELNLQGYRIYFGNGAASIYVDPSQVIMRGGMMYVQDATGSTNLGVIGANYYQFQDGRFAARSAYQKLLIQMGIYTHAAYGTQFVPFPVAYSSLPVVVHTCPADGNAAGGPGQQGVIATNGFNHFTSQGGAAYTWVAIGPT